MKKKFLALILVAVCCMNAFPQTTSLTIDCQTPGWLSSMINFEDQKTLMNIKVTGYINSSDLNFIKRLNNNYSLSGVIDLEDVVTVQGGSIKGDSLMPQKFMSGWKHLQKFVYPKSLIAQPYLAPDKSEKIDSIIWTSDKVKELYVTWFNSDISLNKSRNCDYIYLSEGVEEISDMPNNLKITFPKSLKKITEVGENLTIYSFIDDPESVYAERDFGYGTLDGYYHNYCATITNSTFYIPKGTKQRYLNSDFATMKPYTGNGTVGSNGNVFIEYYDIDSTIVTPSLNMYVGDIAPLNVSIYPDDNLVSWIDYISNNPDIVYVKSDGTIVANNYGQAEISVTPHIFIDDLETKTGICVVNVIAHTEGIEMASSLAIHIDEEKRLEAFTLPLEYSDNQITFSSSDSSIAEVTEDGIVKGIKKGSCTITATSVDGGYTATCEVSVTQPVEALSLEKHSLSLRVGETESMYAQIAPLTADDKTLNWYSRDEEVAIVDELGNVNAIKAGETWIVAVSNDNVEAKDSCKVTVLQPVNGITLNHNTYQMNGIGESFSLEAIVSPDDASNKEVNWKSSNESVCIVSNGTVVAVGEGTCVIIATSVDGGFIATCTVFVSNDTSIQDIFFINGDTYQLFDLQGRKQNTFHKGVNLIRFADGTIKKVFIK